MSSPPNWKIKQSLEEVSYCVILNKRLNPCKKLSTWVVIYQSGFPPWNETRLMFGYSLFMLNLYNKAELFLQKHHLGFKSPKFCTLRECSRFTDLHHLHLHCAVILLFVYLTLLWIEKLVFNTMNKSASPLINWTANQNNKDYN